MIIEMDTHMRHTTEFAETLTKEQRNYAKEQMARQLADLLARSPRENLYWQESVTDLIDLAHEVYMGGRLVDGQGRAFSFSGIVRRACAVLHVPAPHNPYSMAYNARNRKGVRQTSFFSRYCWMMYVKRVSNPLNGTVVKLKMNNEE